MTARTKDKTIAFMEKASKPKEQSAAKFLRKTFDILEVNILILLCGMINIFLPGGSMAYHCQLE